jgi:hypothetical protein
MNIVTSEITSEKYMDELYNSDLRSRDQTIYYIEGILHCLWIFGYITADEFGDLEEQSKTLYKKYKNK